MGDLFEPAGFAGLLLGAGGVASGVLVATSLAVSPAIWNGPEEAALRLIAAHGRIWRTANVGFALATILTAAGLFVVTDVVGRQGATLAIAAAVAYALAGTLWLVTLAIRLSITPGVASAFVAEGAVDPAFATLGRLSSAMFTAFIFVGAGALVLLGAAILYGGVITAILGWITAMAGLAIVASYLWFGDTLPAFIYMPTTAIGIALLVSSL
jgi:hypothetical protein